MSQEQTPLAEKILLLRPMEIFEGLRVAELAAVASVTEDQVAAKGEAIVKEGDVGETMYLIISGKVSVSNTGEDGCAVTIARMGPGDYFGEMALVEDQVRSATVSADEETRLLVLHKREFVETVREYPQVALQMCKELSRRLRRLHERLQRSAVCELPDLEPTTDGQTAPEPS